MRNIFFDLNYEAELYHFLNRLVGIYHRMIYCIFLNMYFVCRICMRSTSCDVSFCLLTSVTLYIQRFGSHIVSFFCLFK